jgi:hypothetical protein
MQTLWFMQGHLKDLSSSDRDAYSFITCERVFSKVHEIIYDESTSDSSASVSKLPAHLNASVVGLGFVAAATGLPALAHTLSPTVMKQARMGAGGKRRRMPRRFPVLSDEAELQAQGELIAENQLVQEPLPDSDQEDNDTDDVTAVVDKVNEVNRPPTITTPQDLPASHLGKLLRQQPLAARTNPSLPLLYSSNNHGSKSLDFRIADERARSPHMSTPSLPISQHTSPRFDNDHMDHATQATLLRKHYLQNEVKRFLCTRPPLIRF